MYQQPPWWPPHRRHPNQLADALIAAAAGHRPTAQTIPRDRLTGRLKALLDTAAACPLWTERWRARWIATAATRNGWPITPAQLDRLIDQEIYGGYSREALALLERLAAHEAALARLTSLQLALEQGLIDPDRIPVA